MLSASGTAAVLSTSDQEANTNTPPVLAINLQPRPVMTTSILSDSEKPKEAAKEKDKPLRVDVNLANQARANHPQEWY